MPSPVETSDSGGRRNLRRTEAPDYKEENGNGDDDVNMEESEEAFVEEEENPASSEESLEDMEEEEETTRRSNRRAAKGPNKASARNSTKSDGRRTSSRANKFSASMADPGNSIRDLLRGEMDFEEEKSRKTTRRDRSQSRDDMDMDEDSEDESTSKRPSRSRAGRRGAQDSLGAIANRSPFKSPARRHAKARLSISTSNCEASDVSDESSGDELDIEESDTEPLRIQRIVAARTETMAKWREICRDMNTSEIDYGSRWFQANSSKDDPANDNVFEERFLVKWADLSYLHCSWETQDDLIDQIEGAKAYLTTFFRKSENGLLFSADERCDGDFFDPAFTQIDRILEIHPPEDGDEQVFTSDDEDGYTSKDFGIVMDKSDPKFEDGTGRQFLVKWCNTPYSLGSYEFERDLILNDIDYKEEVKAFLRRNKKPTKDVRRACLKSGESERRKLYKFLGDKSKMAEEECEAAIAAYRKELEEYIYPNGGQLRDYQAEGVAWMIANYLNGRSSILADEMGLGKTLQTCTTVMLLATKFHCVGPALIVAPLSTLSHWQREFKAWTGLNTIVYHGSAEDRELIRSLEMAYECDRPQSGVAFNQLYLKKCGPKRPSNLDCPWMAQVVITTPEMLVTDDYSELTAVNWSVLVVDEAHRLKNHSSKLAVNLRDNRFSFDHRILLTGTPIQNDVQEFWTLLNFVQPDDFDDIDEFMEKYGDMKSKEKIDKLHEEIRPYILRRLKEDVEKSVPPKEETLIEVELTVSQKKYYRALYERNVQFLHKNKKKALDGPSLNNLAMQLRKCCNHLFLLNGVEEEYRNEQFKANKEILEGDFLAKASGKLVLLDKLLPRLKEEGHRILLFSQFKIMLDILEDYFNARSFKFERIDGSITGHKRQQAIDRFQAPVVEGRESPFIMMLSTRAGGVGINLTSADTVVIFDSDWNPQNDLQAQARCHRIGQTKNVKVFRLLTSKTYEMQMFHMSSLKMGLDQAVLHGFESGSSGEGALSKEEVEKLLRHGAYDIFNEDNAGKSEAESNDFVQQDIDAILKGRSRTVVHDNKGSQGDKAGSTFSKARFTAAKTPDTTKDKTKYEDVDIEDPDFWKKMVGEPTADEEDDLAKKPRQRSKMNYSENAYMQELDRNLFYSDEGESSDDDELVGDEDELERGRWGGSALSEWKREHAESLIRALQCYGYGRMPWAEFVKQLTFHNSYEATEIKRMSWALILLTILDVTEAEVAAYKAREERIAEKTAEKKQDEAVKPDDGGVLAVDLPSVDKPQLDEAELKRKTFAQLLGSNVSWIKSAFEDAVAFAKENEPRPSKTLEKYLAHDEGKPPKPATADDISASFAENVWPSLKGRGWKAEFITEGASAGKTRYTFEGKDYSSHESVLNAVRDIHPELSNVTDSLLEWIESSRRETQESLELARAQDLSLSPETADMKSIQSFLNKYAPLQLLVDRSRSQPIRLSRRILSNCSLLHTASIMTSRADASTGDEEAIDRLAKSLVVDKRSTLPHPDWTSKHDAVLIHAITKHGWIDQDTCCRAIIDDSNIKWGAPFQASAMEKLADVSRPKNADHLLATANRAAFLLNSHPEMLEEAKGFNRDLVIRAYCLVRPPAPEQLTESETGKTQAWVVDASALTEVSSSDIAKRSEPIDLPTKRDLLRRAKTILNRVSAGTVTESVEKVSLSSPSHNYAILNQSERCNILLAEMMRGVLKASTNQKSCKTLCTLAVAEAKRRSAAVAALHSAAPQANDTDLKDANEMNAIYKQTVLVEKRLQKAVRQAKNVIRVMLGEEPQKPRGANEKMFPEEKKPVPSTQLTFTAATSKPASKKRSGGTSMKASGDEAIALAAKRHEDRVRGVNKEPTQEVTEVETMIISVACSIGLPAWQEDWESVVLGRPNAPSSPGAVTGDRYKLTWLSFGLALKNLATVEVKEAHHNFAKAKADLKKQKELQQDSSEDTFATCKAKEALGEARRVCYAKEMAAGQAEDYATEPPTLAKKTIMLLEKLRNHMKKVKTTEFSVRWLENGLGAKVLLWFGREIIRWARSLDLLDEKGKPLAFSAVDFLEDLPEDERSTIEIATSFNEQGCRHVISQISGVSRIRSIFVNYNHDELLSMVEKATVSSAAMEDKWKDRPGWWGIPDNTNGWNGVNHDLLLLERLLFSGYAGVLTDTHSYGQDSLAVAYTPFKQFGLSKYAIQTHVGHIARELNAIEETGNSFRMLEERRNVTKQEAAKKPVTTSGGAQKGLLSFFGAAPDAEAPPPAKQEVIEIDLDSSANSVQAVSQPRRSVVCDVEVVDSPNGKRKDEDQVNDHVSPPPDKKLRAS